MDFFERIANEHNIVIRPMTLVWGVRRRQFRKMFVRLKSLLRPEDGVRLFWSPGFDVDLWCDDLCEASATFIPLPEFNRSPAEQRRWMRHVCWSASDAHRFIVLTNSEAIVTPALACVADGQLRPQDIICYDGSSGIWEARHVNEVGQVDGGLTFFAEGEAEDIHAFLRGYLSDSKSE